MSHDIDLEGRSALYRIIDGKLIDAGKGSLRQYVIDRRSRKASWRVIARDIEALTAGEVAHEETIKRWFDGDDDVMAAGQ